MTEKTVSKHLDTYGEFEQKPTEIIIVRPDAETLSKQHLQSFVGICASTTCAKGIAMYLIIIPPGGVAKPHFHALHETAIYLLKGRVEILYGQELEQSQVCEAGDFIFTPPGVVHQPRNLSATEPVYIIAARNDPDQEEKLVPYEPTLKSQ
ncbi:MAG: cupin domain-containing protein [Richelia sp. SM1_7_0]|nr:cupin domain-containing protein [Richelia sp. SM1_7_0]